MRLKVALKMNIRKINITIIQSPGKDLHFQKKGLLKHFDLFWCLSEMSTAQACPYILMLAI